MLKSLAVAPLRPRGRLLGPFEYLLVFLSIVLGLAVSDLCVSLNRLLEAGAKVRWDWLSPLAATVAFLKILTQWWTWFGSASVAKGMTFAMFTLLMIAVVLVFLLAATSLPDRVEEDGVDLRAYYRQTSRRYWLLYAAHYVTVNALAVWVQLALQACPAGLVPAARRVAFPERCDRLAFVRIRLLHAVCLIALIGIYLVQFAGHALGR